MVLTCQLDCAMIHSIRYLNIILTNERMVFMNYTDENLMRVMEVLFQKIRQQTLGRERHFPNMERPGTPDRTTGFPYDRPFPRERMEGCFGRITTRDENIPTEKGDSPITGRRPIMSRERVLRTIGIDEPISQNKLAAYLDIRPQSLSELLVKLEKDGYLIRTKNEQDKREMLVSLTEQGKARSKEVESARTEQLNNFLAPLTITEREQLFNLIKKLLDMDK